MRHAGGLAVIKQAMANFNKKHIEHIQAYDPKGGEDNKRRLTGAHETARYSVIYRSIAQSLMTITSYKDVVLNNR